jgi:hypothetical protein
MTNRRSILLVAAAFYPVITPRSFRATELAKELVKKGHHVTVITKYREFGYDALAQEWNMRIEMLGPSRLPVFNISGKGLIGFVNRLMNRILFILFEYPNIELMFQVSRALRKRSHYDMLITIAVPYPVHWGAALARKRSDRIARTWVADCGDPYFNTLDSFKKPFYFKFLDRWYSKKADYITVPFEGAIQGYPAEVRHKIRIIPQGFDFNLEKRSDTGPLNEVPTFAYAGGFIRGSRDPDPLFRFLITLRRPFKFFLFTKHSHMIEQYMEPLGGRLIISDYIPREELMGLLSKMDFLINIDNNATHCSPSKLIDYAIAGRPIMNVDSNFDGKELLAFLNRDYSGRMVIPDIERYHISNIARSFLELDGSG